MAYSAAADAYTFAPEKFEEFFKQVQIFPKEHVDPMSGTSGVKVLFW